MQAIFLCLCNNFFFVGFMFMLILGTNIYLITCLILELEFYAKYKARSLNLSSGAVEEIFCLVC